ncbi:hypothetical protein [Komarekiella delphini-convector]|uniref:hypothetical protein n=1 Tax=Komarekiella delphini-convector TaxID=3050158 RepID=UPI001CD90255|nr:hypothetical protein [Komarekiella delphini-convector]
MSEQSPRIIELERCLATSRFASTRAFRNLNYFEKISDQLDQISKLAHITLASALGLEIRLPELQWRQNFPQFAQ